MKAARAPLGSLAFKVLDSIEPLATLDGVPDGHYAKYIFNSSCEPKATAQKTMTLVEESDGQWRTAGYFIKRIY